MNNLESKKIKELENEIKILKLEKEVEKLKRELNEERIHTFQYIEPVLVNDPFRSNEIIVTCEVE